MTRPPLPIAGGDFGIWSTKLNTVLADLRQDTREWPPLRSGMRHSLASSPFLSVSDYYVATSNAITADTLYLTPVWIPPDGLTITHIGLEVVTGLANTDIRLGIYETNTSTGLAADLDTDAGIVEGDTSGFKEIALSATILRPSNTFPWLWLAAVQNQASTFRAAAIYGGAEAVVGRDGNQGNAATPSLLGVYSGLRMSHTFGALPSSASTAIAVAYAYMPLVYVKVA